MEEIATGVWDDDHLGRKADAAFLETFLLNRISERASSGKKRSFVLNIDAGWGRGKSFFLDRFASQLRSSGYLVASVNAWRDDHTDDPMVAVMAAIDTAVKPLIPRSREFKRRYEAVKANFGAIVFAGLRGVAVQGAKKLIGEAVEEVVDHAYGLPSGSAPLAEVLGDVGGVGAEKAIEDLFDRTANQSISEFLRASRSIEKFKDSLERLLSTRISQAMDKAPLFIFVDELDRCRPPYAIATLERIKHLFEVQNVIFIVATDTAQLSHSIKSVYGSEFNAIGYLTRFFDRTYKFDAPSTKQLVTASLTSLQLDPDRVAHFPKLTLVETIGLTFDAIGLPPRYVEQSIDLLRSIVTVWPYKAPVQLHAILPMVIGSVVGVEPTLSSDLFTLVGNSVFDERLGPWPSSKFTVFSRSRDSGSRYLDITPHDAFVTFMENGRAPLSRAFELNPTDEFNEWAVGQFRAEMQLVHNNMQAIGSEPHSVIRTYPDIVKKAGRLTLEP